MEVQKEGEEEEAEEDKWKERQNKGGEEERAERSTDSTIHTVPELLLLLEAQQVSLPSSPLLSSRSTFLPLFSSRSAATSQLG